MDKTLDEIIAAKPRNARRGSSTRRTAGGRQPLNKSSNVAAKTRAATAASQPASTTTTQGSVPSDRIVVSNLPQDVNEQQIRELFATTIGPLREVNLHYDGQGRSKGSASCTFNRKGDASKAYQQYNNRLIDGKRPMKIEMLVDPSRTPAASLAARVTPKTTAAPAAAQATRTAGRGGRGRGGGRRGGKSERPQKSAADLDAEMEDYSNETAAPAAAAAA